MNNPDNQITLLYTNIGRGHPFYLDGITEALTPELNTAVERKDVFDLSHGLSLAVWKTVRWLYRCGSTDSIVGRFYNRFRSRSDYNSDSLPMRLLGRDIRISLLGTSNPLIVAHPLLVGLLSGRPNLIYQHGEIAVPRQALVKGAVLVFVPTEKAAKMFIQSGYSAAQVVVTGLCIEPSLVQLAESAFHSRMNRLNGNGQLTGAFYSSGAEPQVHINSLTAAVVSSVHDGGRAIVYARKGGKLERRFRSLMAEHSIEYAVATAAGLADSPESRVILCSYEYRWQESALTTRMFERFDYLVAPSHERTNWALGLGLPTFILDPPIGPFAPLNRQELIEAGVARPLENMHKAEAFAEMLNKLHSELDLSQMAESGWGKTSTTGFKSTADFLVNKFRLNS